MSQLARLRGTSRKLDFCEPQTPNLWFCETQPPPSIGWVALSSLVRSSSRIVTSPLISTIRCFWAYKPYIFCEDMILATCQCQHIFWCWVEPSLLLSSIFIIIIKTGNRFCKMILARYNNTISIPPPPHPICPIRKMPFQHRVFLHLEGPGSWI